jgi:hypothetical protein
MAIPHVQLGDHYFKNVLCEGTFGYEGVPEIDLPDDPSPLLEDPQLLVEFTNALRSFNEQVASLLENECQARLKSRFHSSYEEGASYALFFEEIIRESLPSHAFQVEVLHAMMDRGVDESNERSIRDHFQMTFQKDELLQMEPFFQFLVFSAHHEISYLFALDVPSSLISHSIGIHFLTKLPHFFSDFHDSCPKRWKDGIEVYREKNDRWNEVSSFLEILLLLSKDKLQSFSSALRGEIILRDGDELFPLFARWAHLLGSIGNEASFLSLNQKLDDVLQKKCV